jgi:hypothetical protein
MKKLLYVVVGLIAGVLLTLAYINYSQKPAEYLQAEQLIEDQLLLALEVESMEFVRTFTGRDSALIILDYMETLPQSERVAGWDFVHYYNERKTMEIGEVWKAKLENGRIVFMLSVDGEFVGLLNNRYSVLNY